MPVPVSQGGLEEQVLDDVLEHRAYAERLKDAVQRLHLQIAEGKRDGLVVHVDRLAEKLPTYTPHPPFMSYTVDGYTTDGTTHAIFIDLISAMSRSYPELELQIESGAVELANNIFEHENKRNPLLQEHLYAITDGYVLLVGICGEGDGFDPMHLQRTFEEATARASAGGIADLVGLKESGGTGRIGNIHAREFTDFWAYTPDGKIGYVGWVLPERYRPELPD
jgi:hypothetical protein